LTGRRPTWSFIFAQWETLMSEDRIRDLVEQMTLAEQVSLL
jgi:hypothetical protein